jgi:hypothetical protein
MLLVSACDDHTDVDNWPTYEVRGTVRTSAGVAVARGLVELRTYGLAGCGAEPEIAYSPALTDATGRYRAQQDEPSGVLQACFG